MTESVKVIERVIDILECFSKNNSNYSLKDICNQTALHPSTALRLIRTLEKRKFLFRNKDKTYSLGLGVFVLGNIARDYYKPQRIVYSFMERIWKETQETVSLFGPGKGNRMCYEHINSPFLVRCSTRVGEIFPLWAGSSGRALLAFLGEEVIFQEIKKIHKIASNTITDPEELLKSLKQVRDNGYAYSFSEENEGARGVAVPIFNVNGDVIFSLGVFGPSDRFTEKKAQALIPKLISISKEITEILG
mgnify:CR=1 FL=1